MIRGGQILTAIILCVALLGLALPGSAAQEEEAPPPDPKTQKAVQYYKEGVRAARERAYDEAIRYLRSSLELRPDLLAAHFSLGYVFEQTGRLDKAEEAYRQVIRVKPENTRAHLNLGNVLETRGRYAEAEQAYREALRLDPKFARAHNNLAWLWVSAPDPALRRPQEALAHAQEAVRLTERMEAGPLDTLAETHYSLGQCLKAVWTEQEAVTEEPSDPGYKKSLERFKLCRDATWAVRDGDVGKARRLWTRVLQLAPNDWRAKQELERLR